jgi:hypothetical protein
VESTSVSDSLVQDAPASSPRSIELARGYPRNILPFWERVAEPLTAEARAAIQSDVDQFYAMFVAGSP